MQVGCVGAKTVRATYFIDCYVTVYDYDGDYDYVGN